MPLLDALREGSLGVRLELPADLAVRSNEKWFAETVDREAGVAITFHFAKGVRFALSEADRNDLRGGIEHYARLIFEQCFVPTTSGPIEATQPRTADRSWSPVVDVEQSTIGPARALRTVHRVAYALEYWLTDEIVVDAK